MRKIIASIFIFQVLLSLGVLAQTRDCDPVVVKGVKLPCMLQEEPKLVVAFKRDNNAWVQIPVQIDEMVMKDVSDPYGSATCLFPSDNNLNDPWEHLFYADPDLPIGKDGNELFDDDDELVFMAKDLGDQISGGEDCPGGVIKSSMCELDVLDPLTSTVIGYIYLYVQDGSLDQSAGANYVTYNFNPSHDYNLADVICLDNGISFVSETSSVTTSNYELGYSARWTEDVLRLDDGSGLLGPDILDRHQAFVYPNICNPPQERNEDTFSESRGPMITAKDGPVRAIRSVMGANSGTYNQMTILFTECRVDYRLDHRVHALAGIPPGVGAYDVLDFNVNAGGMQYYNNQNTGGVTVDGTQDVIVTTNPNDWELYSGTQGSIVVSYDYDTDITFDVSNYVEAYYDDSGTSAMHTCTGDGLAIGSAGFHFATNTCTDRRHNDCLSSPPRFFVLDRNEYLLGPSLSTAEAIKYNDFIHNPLEVSSSGEVCGNTCVPGEPCDDMDPTTENDIWSPNCECVGTPICEMVGDPCDDGDSTTINDMYNSNCICVGTPNCEPGKECDDGNPNTSNDMYNPQCECVGTCTMAGDPCDDGNANTSNDVYNSDCECEGTCTVAGDPCDDGNIETMNDKYDENCVCSGEPCPPPGAPCNDMDPTTENDEWNEDCKCIGTPIPGIDHSGSSGKWIANNEVQSFEIYPTLGDGMINIRSKIMLNEEVEVKIYDMNGVQQLIKKLNTKDRMQIDARFLNTGVYMITVQDEATFFVEKLMIVSD